MGLCESEEQDRLRGIPIVDLFTLPPRCPECLEDLSDPENEGLETCPYCGADLREKDES
jgi:hypothetical protein